MDISPKHAYYGGIAGVAVGIGVSLVQPLLGFALATIGYLTTVTADPMRKHGDLRTAVQQGGVRVGLLAIGGAVFYGVPFFLLQSPIAALVLAGLFIFVIQPPLERRILSYFDLPTSHLTGNNEQEDNPDTQTV